MDADERNSRFTRPKSSRACSRGRLNTLLAFAPSERDICAICVGHLYVSHGGCAHHGIRAMLRVTDVTVKRSDNGIITISVTYFADADNCAARYAELSPRGFDALLRIVP